MKKNVKFQRNRKGWNLPQRGPEPLKEESEFGPARQEFVFCSGCGIVYYHKSWHHALEDWKHLSGKKMIKFIFCPACQMIKDKKFEGELTISEIGSEKLKKEIKSALRNSGETAFQRDPLDRIIKIEERKNRLVVQTTENQLAVKLAKKIKATFGGKMMLNHCRGEDIMRVKLVLKH